MEGLQRDEVGPPKLAGAWNESTCPSDGLPAIPQRCLIRTTSSVMAARISSEWQSRCA